MKQKKLNFMVVFPFLFKNLFKNKALSLTDIRNLYYSLFIINNLNNSLVEKHI